MPTSILLSVVAILSSYIATLNTTVTYSASPEAPVAVVEELSSEERIVKAIHETFPEEPELMVRIARCESSLNPTVVSKTKDGGIFQINDFVHGETLKQLDLDPLILEDNLAYARHLYNRNGTRDWYMSKHCWGQE